ncbi:helix-turn-helix transcriptional regulator [Thalassospira marina]|uniref:HTH luxR-type domain-containing protein n=1 Tax=Thalassospira marina TaxID=2048283 RepID=A0A2N3KER7_9PROT|nr:LuxR family transcriptional regulator [Thalassospira marina]AUG55337.1 hypothetical protein CSC3H3_20895 [Thalassospira marina]PKR49048.1 hypothetical protein COO20_23075 [Thalassospira marina]
MITNPNNDLFDLLNALDNAHDVPAAWQAGLRFFRKFGARQITYGLERLDGSIVFLTTLPDWWMRHYLDNNYAIDDPLVDVARTYIAPRKFDTAFTDFPVTLSPKARQMLNEFGETESTAGLVIPAMTPMTQQLSALTISNTMDTEEFSKFYRGKETTLILAAHAVQQRCQELDPQLVQTDVHVAPRYSSPLLSTRERECLLWLCKGLRNDAIAERMGITRVTVEMHLRNCRQKLGARTREQAVVTAIKQGFITP